MIEFAKEAKSAAVQLTAVHSEQKNTALLAIANALSENTEKILAANKADLARAHEEAVSPPLLARLTFDEKKIAESVAGIHSLVSLEDPVNRTLLHTELDSGLDLYRVACPIGVIGVVFESRPDALIQISSLCLKSANAVILKGGSEAKCTNRALFEIIEEATVDLLPPHWIHLIETHEDVNAMLKLDEWIDLLIPRGSNQFVKYIMNNSTIPVLGHADGICHMYIDAHADVEMAVALATDSKAQYVSVCNALETLLVHRDIASEFLPKLQQSLQNAKVEIRGDSAVCAIISAVPTEDNDWATEYLDAILSVKIVADLEEAIAHINTYGSRHTDAIVSNDTGNVERFFTLVDSANVFHNASTRFSDGFRYGFGAEVGVSTSKIHSRGPVGLEGLLIYKYRLYGQGQTVAPYAKGEKHFTHRKCDV